MNEINYLRKSKCSSHGGLGAEEVDQYIERGLGVRTVILVPYFITPSLETLISETSRLYPLDIRCNFLLVSLFFHSGLVGYFDSVPFFLIHSFLSNLLLNRSDIRECIVKKPNC